MKRIYKEYSYGKELTGYEYDGIIIEIENEFNGNKGLYGSEKKWYHCKQLKEIGQPSCFDTLKECKNRIDEYLK